MGGWIMSPLAEANEAEMIATGLLPLLKEYAKKVRALTAKARQIQNSMPQDQTAENQVKLRRARLEFASLQSALSRLKPPAVDLIRQASQMVEHGNLGTIARLELSLRLAEFETAIQDAEMTIPAGPMI
jgi:hypothetical protein